MTENTILVSKRKRLTWIFWGICFALGLGFFCFWFFSWRFWEYTTDAYVEGNQVYITPLHSGFVTAIHTDDTFLCEQGRVLVQLDETDALIALDKAKRDLANTVREVCQAFHQVFAYQAEIQAKKANFIKTAQDYDHRVHVLTAGGVSVEDFEHAVAYLREAYYSLRMTEELYDKSLAFVQGTTLLNHPKIKAAADAVRDWFVYLHRCKVYSPVEGLAAQRTIQVGMWVKAGDPLMSVIPLDQIWVNANFKETQMKKMRIGQRVKITSDLYGRDVVFHGKIVGLPGGAGNAFTLLPPQNLSGNWIKIVQRLPVRVALDPEELKRHPLRLGLTLEATVYLEDQEGLLVPSNSAGSPNYVTSIFETEEKGDLALITSIILDNLDPTLAAYKDTPL